MLAKFNHNDNFSEREGDGEGNRRPDISSS